MTVHYFLHPKTDILYRWDDESGELRIGDEVHDRPLSPGGQKGELLGRFIRYRVLTNLGQPIRHTKELRNIQANVCYPRLLKHLEIPKEQQHLIISVGRGKGYQWKPLTWVEGGHPPKRPPPGSPEEDRYWVFLESDSFHQGDDHCPWDRSKPAHPVTIKKLVAFGRYEVTNRLYSQFLCAADRPAPTWMGQSGFEDPEQPVVGISWYDAMAFARWMDDRMRKAVPSWFRPEWEVRLPSEAEWEFAARGREGRLFPWGDTQPTRKHACFDCRFPNKVHHHPSGMTATGIHNLAGNVAEWCRDHWDEEAYQKRIKAVIDPVVDTGGELRVIRGGHWRAPLEMLRASFREGLGGRVRDKAVGFRLCLGRRVAANESRPFHKKSRFF
ncbi:MAG: SUMF1/EgtB/PvdO family nonheme iron enzyme [Acidobacteriota bacterium]|nr:SUMF1/EgtB/PvdO family nonheme iron enzyme [Acidobacteriota bacterium]